MAPGILAGKKARCDGEPAWEGRRGQRVNLVFAVPELTCRWRLWLETKTGTSAFAIVGLTLLCPQEMWWEGTVSQKEVREGEIKRPGVLDLDREDW